MIHDHALLAVDNYILLVDESTSADHWPATLLWNSGAPCYTVKSKIEFDAMLAQRAEPDLILLRLDTVSTAMVMQLQHYRIRCNKPLLCIVPEQLDKPEIHAILQMTDDFVCRPVQDDELRIRIRRLLRHPVHDANGHSVRQAVSIDLNKRQIARNNRLMTLSPTEVKLLAKLDEHHGRTVPFEELVTCIDAPNFENQLNALRVHVRRLRQKLESDPKQPEYLLTARGAGYQLLIPSQVGSVVGRESIYQNGASPAAVSPSQS